MVYVGNHDNMKKRSVPAVVLIASKEEGGYFSCISTHLKDYTVTFGKS